MAIEELIYEQLQALSRGDDFDFASTRSLEPLREIIGQDRAVRALEFGLGIRSKGYNIYVAGHPGTGRRHVITRFLAERTPGEPSPPDWCYVHNFLEADRPLALRLDSGRGPAFAADVQKLIADLGHDIARAFESEVYIEQKNEIAAEIRDRRESIQQKLNDRLRQKGFGLQPTSLGVGIVPLNEAGEPMSREDFQALSEERRQAIQAMQESVQSEIESMVRDMRQLDAEMRDRISRLDAEMTRRLAADRLKALCEKYHEYPRVCDYLRALLDDVVRNVDLFRDGPDEKREQQAAANPFAAMADQKREAAMHRYEVNVLVTHDPKGGAPIVYEPNPTHPNLFGRIERRYTLGALVTDFTMIKAGALHRANGGYLVVSAVDLLTRPGSWDALKQAIESSEVRMEDLLQAMGYAYSESLRPEPIPLETKIIIYGNPYIYQLLYALDEDFRNQFKVKAEFGLDMDRSGKSLEQLAGFVARQAAELQLLPFDASAVAAVANHASRLIGDREKVSTQFTAITNLLCEADHWARQARAKTVSAKFVRKAIDEKTARSDLVEQRLREAVRRGTLLIDTRGKRVGQINGLVVYQLGDYDFGMPSRVTANVYIGSSGVVHIERRTDMSGPSHTKGVEILAGLLGERFCQDRPLSLTATLTFEQSYGGVEGDSASAAEYFALLSALAAAPLSQSIAVTGSVNQKGDLQPIGGVTQKVEGFFDACRIRGLTGRQGCLIPRSNVRHLVLRPDVCEAIRKGRFHIWAADTVDDGIELLTGVPAGQRDRKGAWTPRSIAARVDARLQEYAEKAKSYGDKDDKKNNKKGKKK